MDAWRLGQWSGTNLGVHVRRDNQTQHGGAQVVVRGSRSIDDGAYEGVYRAEGTAERATIVITSRCAVAEKLSRLHTVGC